MRTVRNSAQILEWLSPWTEVDMGRVAVHSTANYQHRLAKFAAPHIAVPMLPPRVFKSLASQPYLDSGGLKLSKHSKLLYLELKGRNLGLYVVMAYVVMA